MPDFGTKIANRKHYRILTCNHVIDVIANEQPVIIRLNAKEKI